MKLEVGAKTDVGLVRDHNEDSFCVNLKNRVFIVADGMGGHAAGEVASNQLKDYIEEYVVLAEETDAEAIGNHLQKAVQRANRHIHDLGLEDPTKRGMGTTATILLFTEDYYYIAQVGDSRAYLFRNGELTQLTKDHSKVYQLYEHGLITKDEIEDHPYSNIITRSIGTRPTVEADIYRAKVQEGDRFLACSDGLTGEVKDQSIEAALKEQGAAQQCCEELVRQALRNGGRDNVTVLVVDVIARAGSMRQTVPISKKDVERILAAKEREKKGKEQEEPLPSMQANSEDEKRESKFRSAPSIQREQDDPSPGFLWHWIAILAVLGLALLLYLIFGGPSKPCSVKLYTMPSGAELYIDGTYVGKSPYEAELSSGEYRITAAREGYEKAQLSLIIKEGEHGPKSRSIPLNEKSSDSP